MPAIQTTFVDLTSIVPAAWFNRLQKHLAGFMNLKVTTSGTSVQVTAASDSGAASVYIGGEMRRNDTTASVVISGGADTYNVYAVATAAVDTFALEFSATTPATSPYRKIAEVDWDGAAITALRGVRQSDIFDHDHDDYEFGAVSHGDVTGAATGDPHTQYMQPSGDSFSGPVGGVSPVAAADLATRAYAEGLLLTVPTGTVFWWPSSDAAPTGFLLCDGSAVSRTTYASLFGVLDTDYGAGDGSTTFNLPNVKGRFVVGSNTGQVGFAGGGSLEHTHTQGTHTHTQNSHTHTSPVHSHTGATTGSGGSHTHTQGSTSTSTNHTHTGPSHTHGATGISAGASGAAGYVSRTTDAGVSGLFSEDDLDGLSSSHSHRHADGSYSASGVPVSGYTDYRDPTDHSHTPTGNAYAHTHPGGTVSGSSGSGGTGNTGNPSANHSHTNPTTASGGSHTHASGGSTGNASPTTDSGGAVATAAAGGDATGSAAFPYLTMRAIIKY